MPLNEEREKLLKFYQERLKLNPEQLQEEASIEQAYKDQKEKLDHKYPAKGEVYAEDLQELEEARRGLLLIAEQQEQQQQSSQQQKQTMTRTLNQLILQNADTKEQELLIENSFGQQVTVTIPQIQQANQQMQPTPVFLLPRPQPGQAGQTLGKEVQAMSEQAARSIADQQKPPLPIQPNNRPGQVSAFTTNQSLDPQKQQQLQKELLTKFLTMLANNFKVTLNQETLAQKDTQQKGTAPNPFGAGRPTPPTGAGR